MRLVVAAGLASLFQQCLPDPAVDPPIAQLDVTCITPDCLVIELSSLDSVGADDVAWFVDGVDFGIDGVITIDVPEQGLMLLELEVSNGGGSDQDMAYMFTTGVVNDTTQETKIMASVVATGGNVCDSTSVISTVGGCFSNTGGSTLEHVVSRVRSGGAPLVSTMAYDPGANIVTSQGNSAAVVWKRSTAADPSLQAVPVAALGLYGPRPKQLRNVVGPNQDHLTSYYPIATGDTLTFDLGHGAYLGDPELVPLDSLILDCASGNMVVTTVPN